MKTLAWNEEYILIATKMTDNGLKKIKTVRGKGFSTRFAAESEFKRLRSLGYEVKISVGVWN